MFPAYVYIPCVLGIEDKVTVVALVSSWEVDVFDVARQSVSPCRCLVTDSTLVSHHTSLLLYSLNILYQTLLVGRIISCKKYVKPCISSCFNPDIIQLAFTSKIRIVV